MPDLSKLLEGLSPEQRKELLRRIEGRGIAPKVAAKAAQPGSNAAVQPAEDAPWPSAGDSRRRLDFSLLFFSGNGATDRRDKYEIVIESAKFADRHAFCAVWTPERHFQDFGGLFPNPSVLAAALSMVTKRIQIRAGSVVAPLHHPIRIAEEWSVVDNLSDGRVEMSFASGYHPGDFMLAPENYRRRKEIMFETILTVRRLWAGEAVAFRNVDGEEREVTLLPKPLQKELPVWVTSSSSTDTWIKAGELGANMLTGLPGIGGRSFEDLSHKIALYRQSLAMHGYDPHKKKVALMLHTFLGTQMDEVRKKVKAPLADYLQTFISQDEHLTTNSASAGMKSVRKADKDALISFALQRFINNNSLIGTPERCARFLRQLSALGVDEIACFIDFGLDWQSILESLRLLSTLIAYFSEAGTRAGQASG